MLVLIRVRERRKADSISEHVTREAGRARRRPPPGDPPGVTPQASLPFRHGESAFSRRRVGRSRRRESGSPRVAGGGGRTPGSPPCRCCSLRRAWWCWRVRPRPGKSTWAAAHFPPSAVVSSDALRGVVGAGEDDIAASTDAFALLDEIVARRVARGLTTVIDTTGMDAERRAPLADARAASTGWRASRSPSTRPPRSAGPATAPDPTPCPPPRSPPSSAPGPRFATRSTTRASTRCSGPSRCGWCLRTFARSDDAAARQQAEPFGLRFALHLSAFPGGAATLAPAAARDRRRGRGGGLRRDLHDGPLPPDPAGRARVGRLPRELHDARVAGGVHVAGAAGRARRRRHLPQRRAPGQDRRHAGRAVRRPGGVRARAGLVRRGAPGVRVAVPAGRRAVRAARGRARRAAGALGAGRQAVPGPGAGPARHRGLPPTPAGARADPARRRRRAADAGARRALRRRGQRAGRPADRRAQGRRAAGALCGERAGGGVVAPDHGTRRARPGRARIARSPGTARAARIRPGGRPPSTRARSTTRSGGSASSPRSGSGRWPCGSWISSTPSRSRAWRR